MITYLIREVAEERRGYRVGCPKGGEDQASLGRAQIKLVTSSIKQEFGHHDHRSTGL